MPLPKSVPTLRKECDDIAANLNPSSIRLSLRGRAHLVGDEGRRSAPPVEVGAQIHVEGLWWRVKGSSRPGLASTIRTWALSTRPPLTDAFRMSLMASCFGPCIRQEAQGGLVLKGCIGVLREKRTEPRELHPRPEWHG